MPEPTSSTDMLSLVANILQVATWIGLPTVAALAAWLWRDRAVQKKTTQALIDSVAGLGQQLAQLQALHAATERRDPVAWLARSREMADRDAAMAWLDDSIKLTSEALAETFFRLAEHANLVYPGNDPAYLSEAYRLARLAFLLAPQRTDARELVQELEMTTSYLQHKLGTFDPDRTSALPAERGAIVQDQVEDYLAFLLGLAIDHVQAGDNASYEIVTRHARRVGMAVLPVNHSLMLNARQLWAEALYLSEHFERALAEIMEIEAPILATLDPTDQRVRELRMMKAVIQTTLGDTAGLEPLAQAAREMGLEVGPGPVRKDIEIPEDVRRSMADRVKTIASEPFDIALDSAFEIQTWTESLRCSEAQLRAAVAAVGSSAPAVRAYLRQQRSG